MVASADLKLRGTYDRPLLFGRAEIDRGDILFEGNRYVVTRGSIDFFNPAEIEPYFDIEAETRVRVPGSDCYRVTLGFTGTTSRFTYSLNSDPPLPEVDIISLLLGQTTDLDRRRAPGAAAERGAAVRGGAAAPGDLAAADEPDLGAGQPHPRRDARHRDGRSRRRSAPRATR